MADSEATPAAPEAPAPAAVPVVPAPAAPAPEPAAPAPDPFEDEKVQQFDRKYVETLRKENADRRTAIKKYEESFSGYNPQEQDIWLGLARLTAEDPKEGAKLMREIAEALVAEDKPPVTTPDPVTGEEKPLTRAELEAFYKQKESEVQMKSAVAELQSEAKKLGYDPESWQYKALLHRAELEFDYDIGKAHTANLADQRAAVDAFVADKVAKGEKWPQTASVGQPAPADPAGGPPKTLEQARDSLRSKLLGR